MRSVILLSPFTSPASLLYPPFNSLQNYLKYDLHSSQSSHALHSQASIELGLSLLSHSASSTSCLRDKKANDFSLSLSLSLSRSFSPLILKTNNRPQNPVAVLVLINFHQLSSLSLCHIFSLYTLDARFASLARGRVALSGDTYLPGARVKNRETRET